MKFYFSQNSNIDEVDAVFNRGQFLTEKKGLFINKLI